MPQPHRQLLHEGRQSSVYLVSYHGDAHPVVEKVEKPPSGPDSPLERERSILTGLEIDGVRRIRRATSISGQRVLHLEYAAGVPLSELIQSELIRCTPPRACIEIFIRIADILSRIHDNNIIHKNLNPANIIVDPDTLGVTIIDFGTASRIERRDTTFRSPQRLESELTYMSPEQTGRMNRVVDTRSDLYSLGVMLYEALTGRAPFVSSSRMALVHAHLAQVPTDPGELVPSIPAALSASCRSSWPRTPKSATNRLSASRPTCSIASSTSTSPRCSSASRSAVTTSPAP